MGDAAALVIIVFFAASCRLPDPTFCPGATLGEETVGLALGDIVGRLEGDMEGFEVVGVLDGVFEGRAVLGVFDG